MWWGWTFQMIEDLPRKGTFLMKRTFPGRHKLDPNKEAEQKLVFPTQSWKVSHWLPRRRWPCLTRLSNKSGLCHNTVSIYPSNNQQINQSVNQTNRTIYQSVPLTAQSNNQAINYLSTSLKPVQICPGYPSPSISSAWSIPIKNCQIQISQDTPPLHPFHRIQCMAESRNDAPVDK